MNRKVRVLSAGGLLDVGNGHIAKVNEVVVLSPEEWAALQPFVARGYIEDLGATSDPETGAPTSSDGGTSEPAPPVVFKGMSSDLKALDEWVGRWAVVDDGTATGSWPNRFIVEYKPATGEVVQTFSLNEYGEARLIPAKTSTVGFRVFEKQFRASANHSASTPIAEVMNNRDDRVSQWAVLTGGRTVQAGSATFGGAVTAPNLPPAIITLGASDPVPGGTPAGTLIVRRAT